jgi:hypothetical protein
MEISKEQIRNFNNEFKQLKMAGGAMPNNIAKIEIEEGGIWAEGRIPRQILKQIGEEAYKDNPRSSLTDENGNTWRMVDKFPTMVSYQSPAYRFKYVVGIRGTKLTSWTDIKADVAHLFGKVRESDRYTKDKEYLLSMIRRHGKHNRWILVGHSLAGAIIKRLANDLQTKNYIDYTLSYNPSFELSDVTKSKKNEPDDTARKRLIIPSGDEKIHEVYSENDPLLKIRQIVQPNVEQSPNIEVKKEEEKGLLESHSIENPTFSAGAGFVIPQEIKDMPKFKKMKHGIYKNLAMIREMKKNKKYDNYFKNVKADGKMRRWLDEQWVDVKEALKGKYKPCGRSSTKKKPYPACRPMKKLEGTPITLPALLQEGAVKKIKEAIKKKEKNPNFRINWQEMIE